MRKDFLYHFTGQGGQGPLNRTSRAEAAHFEWLLWGRGSHVDVHMPRTIRGSLQESRDPFWRQVWRDRRPELLEIQRGHSPAPTNIRDCNPVWRISCDGLRIGYELTRVEAAASGTSAAKARRQTKGFGTRVARGRDYFEERRLDNIYLSAHRAI